MYYLIGESNSHFYWRIKSIALARWQWSAIQFENEYRPISTLAFSMLWSTGWLQWSLKRDACDQ